MNIEGYKFKVGDIVTLMKEEDFSDNTIGYVHHKMGLMVGLKLTIDGDYGDDIYKIKECKHGFGYKGGWLEFYEEEDDIFELSEELFKI